MGMQVKKSIHFVELVCGIPNVTHLLRLRFRFQRVGHFILCDVLDQIYQSVYTWMVIFSALIVYSIQIVSQIIASRIASPNPVRIHYWNYYEDKVI